jgi:hypothetical protein
MEACPVAKLGVCRTLARLSAPEFLHLCWPKEKEPREMAWFNPPGLQTGGAEGFGTTLGDTIFTAATPRRI